MGGVAPTEPQTVWTNAVFHPLQIGLSVIVVWVLIRTRNDEFPKMLHLGESRPIYVPLNNPKYGVSHGRDVVQIFESFFCAIIIGG